MDRVKGRFNEILRQLQELQVNDPNHIRSDMRQTLIEELVFRHRQLVFKSNTKKNQVKRLD
jgi:hypothetical protein